MATEFPHISPYTPDERTRRSVMAAQANNSSIYEVFQRDSRIKTQFDNQFQKAVDYYKSKADDFLDIVSDTIGETALQAEASAEILMTAILNDLTTRGEDILSTDFKARCAAVYREVADSLYSAANGPRVGTRSRS